MSEEIEPGVTAGTAVESDTFVPSEEIKEGEIAITTEVQGMEPVWTYSAMTSDYALSCAEAFKPFRHGHQQHVMDCTLGREASFFINHPGERAYSGENRPAYWAGNGTVPLTIQYKGLLMMIFSLVYSNAAPIFSSLSE